MLSKLIGKILLAVVILAAGYIGFRMIVFKESFMEAVGAAQKQAKEQLDQHALAKMSPMKRGDYYFGREEYDKAAGAYKEAVERAVAADATDKEKLSAGDLEKAYQRIGDSWYAQAEKSKWEAVAVREAIKAYKDFATRYPNMKTEDRMQIAGRVQELELKQ